MGVEFHAQQSNYHPKHNIQKKHDDTYVFVQSKISQTMTKPCVCHISLDSPCAAKLICCSSMNSFHGPLGGGSSSSSNSVLQLRVKCEALSAQHPVGQVQTAELQAEEDTLKTSFKVNALIDILKEKARSRTQVAKSLLSRA